MGCSRLKVECRAFSEAIPHWAGLISLAPGFSPLERRDENKSRFNGFPQPAKAAEAAEPIPVAGSPG